MLKQFIFGVILWRYLEFFEKYPLSQTGQIQSFYLKNKIKKLDFKGTVAPEFVGPFWLRERDPGLTVAPIFCGNRFADPVGSGTGFGKFSPDPIGTLALLRCINKEKICNNRIFIQFQNNFFRLENEHSNI